MSGTLLGHIAPLCRLDKGAPSFRQPHVRAHGLASRVEAEFQLPLSLGPLGQVPSCTAQCVQGDVAVLVRTGLMDSPKKMSRVCFGNWAMVLYSQKQRMLDSCLEMTEGPWRVLNETLRRLPSLEFGDILGEGVSVALKWRESNLAAYGIGAHSTQKNRVG